MIGETVSHYPPKADEPLAHKIIDKIGGGGLVLRSFNLRINLL